MSLKDVSKEETPHNLKPKYVEEIAKEVLGSKKIVEIFQAMAIVSQSWVIWVWKSSH